MHAFGGRILSFVAEGVSQGLSKLRSPAGRRILAAVATTGTTLTAISMLSPAHARIARHEIPSPDSIPTLSLTAIASAIRTGSTLYGTHNVSRGYVDRYDVAQYPANPSVEDSFAAKHTLASDSGALFGIFDGHTGRGAAQFCQDELLDYLDYYKAEGYTTRIIAGTPFLHADEHFLKYALADKALDRGFSGACALVAHVQQDIVRTASAGDCRAVVGRRREAGVVSGAGVGAGAGAVEEPQPRFPAPAPAAPAKTAVASTSFFSFFKSSSPAAGEAVPVSALGQEQCPAGGVDGRSSGGVPLVAGAVEGPVLLTPPPKLAASKFDGIELSIEHQVDTFAGERERLLAAHPGEEDLLRSSRVKGRLQPTRGVGDGVYKKIEYFLARDRLRERYSVWSPPYTTANPDITAYRLTPRDEFLVLGTDGLFQDLTPQEVAAYVGEYLDSPSERSRHPNAASFLIEKALLHSSEYAVGRRGAAENLSWVLALPRAARRNFHDDITVAVVFFNDELARGVAPSVPDAAVGGQISAPATLERALTDARALAKGGVAAAAASVAAGSAAAAAGTGVTAVRREDDPKVAVEDLMKVPYDSALVAGPVGSARGLAAVQAAERAVGLGLTPVQANL